MSNINTKQILSWLLFVLVLVGLGYFVYITVGKNNKSEDTPKTPAESAIFLNNVNQTKFPAIDKNDSVGFDKLPNAIKGLILDHSISIRSFSTTFTDKSTGFTVTYEYKGDLVDTYRELSQLVKSNYEYIEGRRDDQAGVLVMDDSIFTYKVNMVVSSVGNLKIGIIAKKK